MGKMTEVTLDGTRLEQLKAAAYILAQKLDSGEAMAQDFKQYREYIAEIAFIEDSADDGTEVDGLLEG